MSLGFGELIVFPISAKLKRDTEIIGKMDPYCRISCGKTRSCSGIHKNGGKFPHWKDRLIFPIGTEKELSLEVWDSDTMTENDLIGSATIFLDDTLRNGFSEKWYTISYKGKNAGEVLIKMEFKASAMNGPQFIPQNANVLPMKMGVNSQPFPQPQQPQYYMPYNQNPGYQPPMYPPANFQHVPQQPLYNNVPFQNNPMPFQNQMPHQNTPQNCFYQPPIYAPPPPVLAKQNSNPYPNLK